MSVLERYVRAIADGDFDGVMALRCEPSRTPEDKRELWLSQLERFEDAEGDVTGVDAEVARLTGLRPADDLPNLVEVTYTVEIDGESRAQLLAATVEEDGDRRVCGSATPAAKDLSDEFGGRRTLRRPRVRRLPQHAGAAADLPAGSGHSLGDELFTSVAAKVTA